MDYYEKYLAASLHFLSYRARSEKEVRENLLKKLRKVTLPELIQHEAELTIEKVISFLKEQKFLDDEAFTRGWIESRTRFKQRSKFLIVRELQEKGISKELIEKVLQQEDAPQINELEQAKELVQKRIKKYQGMEKQIIYQKLGGFLGRRGYSWEIIKRSIDDVLQSEYNSD